MGPVFNIPVNMQFLLSASLLAVASAYYPLVTFPNGAVTPFDVTNPVGTYSQAGIPLHHIGKREAQYPLVTFPNGAVTPFDVNNPVGPTPRPESPLVSTLPTARGLPSPSWWPSLTEPSPLSTTPTPSGPTPRPESPSVESSITARGPPSSP